LLNKLTKIEVIFKTTHSTRISVWDALVKCTGGDEASRSTAALVGSMLKVW
jgi:hypothetical protein